MDRIETIDGLRRRWPGDPGIRSGLVPTMGALHSGHAHLIERARAECDTVAVSIFVNPLQFDRKDDLERYPRTIEADLAWCERLGVDVVFLPTNDTMYPSPPLCTVDVGTLGDHLCGRYRPGHFRGVATVVLKLFEIVRASAGYFGEKDGQQLAIIRRLVRDFNLPIDIVGVPTVREADGLAMSSRNVRLDACERALAPSLYQALQIAESLLTSGERRASTVVAAATAAIPTDPALRLEYLEVVNADTMQPVDLVQGPVMVAGALWVGNTRLIDNVRYAPDPLATSHS